MSATPKPTPAPTVDTSADPYLLALEARIQGMEARFRAMLPGEAQVAALAADTAAWANIANLRP